MEISEENIAMFWLRCNKCYRMLKKCSRIFSLTQCQHLFCSECVVGAEDKCPECESLGVKIVNIEKPIQQPLAHYFGSVRKHLQKAYEAAHFQRIQKDIAFRRLAEIQSKYEEMKKTYDESGEQMKLLVEAYTALKERHARISADIVKLQSVQPLVQNRGVKNTTNDDFMARHMYPSPRFNHNEPYNSSGPSSLNSSRTLIATPEQSNWQPMSTLGSSRSSIAPPVPSNWRPVSTPTPQLLHKSQSSHQKRLTNESSKYRYNSSSQGVLLGYTPRVVISDVVTPPQNPRHLDAGWIERNRRPASASALTSTGGSRSHTPMSVDNYSDSS